MAAPQQALFAVPPVVLLQWDSTKTANPNTILLTNGNRTASRISGTPAFILGTVGHSTGFWYFEVTLDAEANVGIRLGVSPSTAQQFNSGGSAMLQLYNHFQAIMGGGFVAVTGGVNLVPGDRLCVAVNFPKIWWGKNNTWMNSGNPAAGTGEQGTGVTGSIFYPAFETPNAGTTNEQVTIYGDTSNIAYAPPSGATPWNG